MIKGKNGIYNRFFKRLIDIVCALLALIAFCWLYAIIAILVRIKLGSPIIFKQARPGKIDPKTGKYVLVNAKTYTVSKSGNVKVTLPEGATYQLLDSKDAEAVEKEILATVKVKKTSTTVKTGKKTTVQMSSKLDMDNVESITYSTSKKSVATVSKNGKVTAKKAGNVTIKVIVTSKNGQTKTVKMKVKVK